LPVTRPVQRPAYSHWGCWPPLVQIA
jgi:hypothetical protein